MLEHDGGALRVEVPSEWEDELTGRDGTFEGKDVEPGEGDGPAITATPDLFAWENVFGATVPGTYVMASRELAQEYAEDELAESGFNDLTKHRCEATQREDFQRSPYSGRIQTWQCENGATFTTLGAAPEGRECVLMLNVRTYDERGREAAQRILDTFEVDCAGLA